MKIDDQLLRRDRISVRGKAEGEGHRLASFERGRRNVARDRNERYIVGSAGPRVAIGQGAADAALYRCRITQIVETLVRINSQCNIGGRNRIVVCDGDRINVTVDIAATHRVRRYGEGKGHPYCTAALVLAAGLVESCFPVCAGETAAERKDILSYARAFVPGWRKRLPKGNSHVGIHSLWARKSGKVEYLPGRRQGEFGRRGRGHSRRYGYRRIAQPGRSQTNAKLPGHRTLDLHHSTGCQRYSSNPPRQITHRCGKFGLGALCLDRCRGTRFVPCTRFGRSQVRQRRRRRAHFAWEGKAGRTVNGRRV